MDLLVALATWSTMRASAMPANTPLASRAMRTPAPRIVSKPDAALPMRFANSPTTPATRALASAPMPWAWVARPSISRRRLPVIASETRLAAAT